jgi:hypothetical protein
MDDNYNVRRAESRGHFDFGFAIVDLGLKRAVRNNSKQNVQDRPDVLTRSSRGSQREKILQLKREAT